MEVDEGGCVMEMPTRDEQQFITFVGELVRTYNLTKDEAIELAWKIACLAWRTIDVE